MVGRRRGAVLLVLYALIVLAITDKRITPSGALLSRLALVDSLVERGTFAIDDSRFSRTVDKVQIDGHFYCDKLPILPVATAAIYAVLCHPLGVTFDSHPGLTLFILTYLTVGIATIVLVALFYREVRRAGLGGRRALLLTGVLGLATLVLTYAGTYQNHTITAVFLFAGFVAIRAAREGNGKAALLSGIWIGMAAASEMPTGFAFGGAFGLSLVMAPRPGRHRLALAGSFAGGFAIPILVTAVILLIAWGDPRPAYLIPGAYDYDGSVFAEREAGVIQSTRIPSNIVAYAFHNILGIRGLFSTTPVLLAGLIGLVSLWRRREEPRRWEVTALGLGLVVVIAFYAVATDSYGGWAYGLRFFVPLAPVLLYLAVYLPDRIWSGRPALVMACLLGLSLPLAWIGAYHPWTPSYQGETIRDSNADIVRWPAAGNLAALLEEWLPNSALAAGARRSLIDPDDAVSYPYLAVSFDSQGKVSERDRMLRGGR
ncbi:MAG: hypothetical protein O7H41_17930 [Planctomycetota bacterium]|nr:hypothetical protein [Planctomycetota bacterium]